MNQHAITPDHHKVLSTFMTEPQTIETWSEPNNEPHQYHKDIFPVNNHGRNPDRDNMRACIPAIYVVFN